MIVDVSILGLLSDNVDRLAKSQRTIKTLNGRRSVDDNGRVVGTKWLREQEGPGGTTISFDRELRVPSKPK